MDTQSFLKGKRPEGLLANSVSEANSSHGNRRSFFIALASLAVALSAGAVYYFGFYGTAEVPPSLTPAQGKFQGMIKEGKATTGFNQWEAKDNDVHKKFKDEFSVGRDASKLTSVRLASKDGTYMVYSDYETNLEKVLNLIEPVEGKQIYVAIYDPEKGFRGTIQTYYGANAEVVAADKLKDVVIHAGQGVFLVTDADGLSVYGLSASTVKAKTANATKFDNAKKGWNFMSVDTADELKPYFENSVVYQRAGTVWTEVKDLNALDITKGYLFAIKFKYDPKTMAEDYQKAQEALRNTGTATGTGTGHTTTAVLGNILVDGPAWDTDAKNAVFTMTASNAETYTVEIDGDTTRKVSVKSSDFTDAKQSMDVTWGTVTVTATIARKPFDVKFSIPLDSTKDHTFKVTASLGTETKTKDLTLAKKGVVAVIDYTPVVLMEAETNVITMTINNQAGVNKYKVTYTDQKNSHNSENFNVNTTDGKNDASAPEIINSALNEQKDKVTVTLTNKTTDAFTVTFKVEALDASDKVLGTKTLDDPFTAAAVPATQVSYKPVISAAQDSHDTYKVVLTISAPPADKANDIKKYKIAYTVKYHDGITASPLSVVAGGDGTVVPPSVDLVDKEGGPLANGKDIAVTFYNNKEQAAEFTFTVKALGADKTNGAIGDQIGDESAEVTAAAEAAPTQPTYKPEVKASASMNVVTLTVSIPNSVVAQGIAKYKVDWVDNSGKNDDSFTFDLGALSGTTTFKNITIQTALGDNKLTLTISGFTAAATTGTNYTFDISALKNDNTLVGEKTTTAAVTVMPATNNP